VGNRDASSITSGMDGLDDLAVLCQVADRIVELGDTAQVYEQPQHPYTKELLAAVPVADPA
jgi:peptide/nickel transport system ATP-binding protein